MRRVSANLERWRVWLAAEFSRRKSLNHTIGAAMDLGIEGKRALVTGADSGIGLATSRALLAEGATVIMTDLYPDRLDQAFEQIQHPDDRLHAFPADATDLGSLRELEAKMRQATGGIDILVNSAGITGAQGLFHEIDDDSWRETIETNLMGPVRVARTFLPSLREGGWGRIVFLASEDAMQPYPEELPYCASKAGLVAFAKGLSKTYAREGLLVNTVSPAFIATPMTDAMMERRAEQLDIDIPSAIESFLDEKRPHIELHRRGQADEVASVIVFLCSELASFVNGANYRVDAGSVASI